MATPPPSPHAEYDRWIERRERWEARWRRFGQIAFYIVGGTLALAFAALLVASLIDSAQPRIWGTFTQTGCEERFRGGCRPFGTWVSDDETIVLHDVYLDGWTDESGTARAGYQPTALVGSDIARVPFLSGFGPWLIGGVLIWWIGYRPLQGRILGRSAPPTEPVARWTRAREAAGRTRHPRFPSTPVSAIARTRAGRNGRCRPARRFLGAVTQISANAEGNPLGAATIQALGDFRELIAR